MWSFVNFSFCTLFCIFTNHPPKINAEKQIQVFKGLNQEGQREFVDIFKCSNLSPWMKNQIKSLDMRGLCARFYVEENCKGNSTEIMARSPGHDNLAMWEFGYKPASIGPCKDQCDPEVTGTQKPGETSTIVLYDERWFGGVGFDLVVQGCTRIPSQLIYKVESVYTNRTCIQLYNNDKCQTEGTRVDSIELRQGTPSHDDIKKAWAFPDARAVSHCQYKCKINGHAEELEPHIIRVFPHKFYKGRGESVDISKCFNLSPSLVRQLGSVDTKGKCARLFTEKDCRGDSIQLYPRSFGGGNYKYFAPGALIYPTASIGPCKDPCDIEITGEMKNNFEITLQGRPIKKDNKVVLVVQGCTIVPIRFISIVESVETNGTRVQLYNNEKCQYKGENVHSIELRRYPRGCN